MTAAATAVNGLLAGASTLRSLVELPAWQRVNLSGFYKYARAADLGRGLIIYPMLGIGAALLVVTATACGYLIGANSTAMSLLWISLILAISHSLATTRAAPNMLSLRTDPNGLDTVRMAFGRFKKWQDKRAALQFLNFLTVLMALAALAT